MMPEKAALAEVEANTAIRQESKAPLKSCGRSEHSRER
jgi:hypothetical protein